LKLEKGQSERLALFYLRRIVRLLFFAVSFSKRITSQSRSPLPFSHRSFKTSSMLLPPAINRFACFSCLMRLV